MYHAIMRKGGSLVVSTLEFSSDTLENLKQDIARQEQRGYILLVIYSGKKLWLEDYSESYVGNEPIYKITLI